MSPDERFTILQHARIVLHQALSEKYAGLILPHEVDRLERAIARAEKGTGDLSAMIAQDQAWGIANKMRRLDTHEQMEELARDGW